MSESSIKSFIIIVVKLTTAATKLKVNQESVHPVASVSRWA